MKKRAVVGVSDHAGWAVLVTAMGDGTLVDRSRIELIESGLPSLPHHHDCQRLPLDQAVALIERVTRSADACAVASLQELAARVPVVITGIALRACPPLPETVEERISNYRAQNVADTVMFRGALERAARARGWAVHFYEVRTVLAAAARAMGERTIEPLLDKTGRELGPPWRKDHRVALAAALAASAR